MIWFFRGTFILAWRDLKSYLHGAGFYVIAAFFSAIIGWAYISRLFDFIRMSGQMAQMGRSDNMNLHSTVMMSLMAQVHLILFFAIPFITMWLLAEEKRTRSFDLLMTSPLSSTQIVIAKIMAGFGAALVLVLISLVYPFFTSLISDVQWAPLFTSYLGLLLLMATYVAIGVFSSSLTQSSILACFMAFVLSLSLWFVAWAGNVVEGMTAQNIVHHISVANHFSQFSKGVVETKGIVFHLSLIFLFGFLTQRVIEVARWR